jgi:flagellar protein FlbD
LNIYLYVPIILCKGDAVIELTRLNGTPLMVNSDLIKTAEAAPDTMLTLITGEKLIVREDCREVMERVTAYRARLLAEVARRLPSGVEAGRVVSMAGLRITENGDAILPEIHDRGRHDRY